MWGEVGDGSVAGKTLTVGAIVYSSKIEECMG